MTKTKRQLRAEAVERLVKLGEVGFYYEIIDALCDADCDDWSGDKVASTIRDLLTDDDANDDSAPEKVVSDADVDVTTDSRYNATNRSISESADRETPETAEIGASKDEIRDFDDSREKLEADVLEIVKGGFVTHDSIIGLLDRQAAITEREVLCHPDERDEQIAELESKLAEYEDTSKIYSAISDGMFLMGPKALVERVAELDRELAAARKAHAQAEHEAIVYRMKLGRALDLAHEIERLAD